mgnify:CR=1 FL=1
MQVEHHLPYSHLRDYFDYNLQPKFKFQYFLKTTHYNPIIVAEDRIQLSAKLPKLIEALLLLLLTEFAVSPGLRGSGVEALLDSLLITLLWLEGAGPHTAEEL